MCSRKFFILCLVLVLALAQVSAWPTRAKEEPVVETQPSVKAEQTSPEPSATMQSDVLTRFSETSTNLENKVVVLGTDLSTLKSDMTDMAAAINMLVKDNTDLRESLKKANGTKYLVDIGVAFGLTEKDVRLGAVGSMGIRFGKNFVSKIGIQYMACDLGKIELPKWNIQDMTVSATIGWEF